MFTGKAMGKEVEPTLDPSNDAWAGIGLVGQSYLEATIIA